MDTKHKLLKCTKKTKQHLAKFAAKHPEKTFAVWRLAAACNTITKGVNNEGWDEVLKGTMSAYDVFISQIDSRIYGYYTTWYVSVHLSRISRLAKVYTQEVINAK